MKREKKAFEELLKIMDRLRAECPWDKAQTFESLRKLTIEETYELADAILKKDYQEIKDELGDLMLHIVFYSRIGSETGKFSILDVLNTINEKLVYRHPHIFGNVEVSDADRFFKAPLHPYAQKLMASVPRLRGDDELEFIVGKPPSLLGIPPGCRFAPRCPKRFDKCDEDPPVFNKSGILVKCWLHE